MRRTFNYHVSGAESSDMPGTTDTSTSGRNEA
jgi:hypothetical protein